MTDLTAAEIFAAAVEMGCSDVHIKPGSPPKARVNGKLITMTQFPVLQPEDTRLLIYQTMTTKTMALFGHQPYSLDYSFDLPTVGRFRMNVFLTRGAMAVAGRLLSDAPKTLDQLGSLPVLKKLAMIKTGIVIVAGATGSGKSTTLAGMINHINENKEVNIISTEDPIEILHMDKLSSISQREIGTDVDDFPSALKSSLRQDPDVILIGEIRDLQTMRTVLVAADTGHLVITTIHATDAANTIDRIIDMYPAEERRGARRALTATLRGVIGQRILPTIAGGRTVVNEVLLNNDTLADLMLDDTKGTKDIKKLISESGKEGMQTFDQGLETLVHNNIISLDTAVEYASDHNYFNNFNHRSQFTTTNAPVKIYPQTNKIPPRGNPPTSQPRKLPPLQPRHF